MASIQSTAHARSQRGRPDYRQKFREFLEHAELDVVRAPQDAAKVELLRRARQLAQKVRDGRLTPAQAWALTQGMPSLDLIRRQLEVRS